MLKEIQRICYNNIQIINIVDVWRLELGYLCMSYLFGYYYSCNSYFLVEYKVEK